MLNEQRIGQLADLLLAFFFNRKDKISVMGSKHPCPARPAEDLRTILRAHVGGPDHCKACVCFLSKDGETPYQGPLRIGTFFPGEDEYVRLACIDFDDHDNVSSLVSPPEAALKTASVLESHGLNVYLEVSGGGKGQHIWMFFDERLPAIDVREALLELVPKDLMLVNGNYADAARNMGVEVFPKTVHLGKNGVGSAVWLPFWHGAEGNANHFWRYNSKSCKGEFHLPESFETSEFPVELLMKVRNSRKETALVNKRNRTGNSVNADWRFRALAELDLYDVYGDWLTGNLLNKPGFLECRDPWSTTGDETPSASVQTGEHGTTKGRFASFVRGESFSVFDFLIELPGNGITTFPEACQRIAELSGVPRPGSRKKY